MNKMIFGALSRHFLAGVGIWLAQSGYASGAEAEAITGGLTALAAIAWSLYQKTKVDPK